jgi:uncharacterized protein (DUF433 family)
MAKTAVTLELIADPPVLERWDDGSIRVAGSRTPFDRFVVAVRAGESMAELEETFPSLSASTLHRLMAYYLDHRAEVDAWYQKLAAQAEARRAEWEKSHPTDEWRRRLKAVRAETRAAGSD